MLLCFIVILFICVVVGVIKYSTAHSLKQEKDIKLSTIDNEKFISIQNAIFVAWKCLKC